MRKFIFGLLISLFFIVFIAYKFDVKELFRLLEKAELIYLIPAIFWQFVGIMLFSLRWYFLLEKALPFKHSVSSSFIGGGANMVLPARGGDLFRVYYCRSETSIQYFNLLSKLFIEKVIDFVYVIFLGAVALLFLNTGRGDAGSFAIFSFSGMVVVGVFIVLFLLRFQNEWIDKTLLKLFHLIKKEEVYKSHMQVHIFELKKFLSFKMLLNPLLVTIVMWACYSLTYYYTGLALAVPMNAAEITFVIFFGAISLAVPSAPSGVGVFHASVISAFIVLKKTSSLGLFFATGIHLLGFVVFTVVGFLFYFYWIYKRRNGKPVNFKEFEDTEKIGN